MPSDLITQSAIALSGPAAIWLSQARSLQLRRWASVIGACSQPFWFLALKDSDQWGIIVVSVVSALGWMWGIWVYWIAPAPPAGGAPSGCRQKAGLAKPQRPIFRRNRSAETMAQSRGDGRTSANGEVQRATGN